MCCGANSGWFNDVVSLDGPPIIRSGSGEHGMHQLQGNTAFNASLLRPC